MAYRANDNVVLERKDLDIMESIDARFVEFARAIGAIEREYGTLIESDVLYRCGYHRTFPNLLLQASSYLEPRAAPTFSLSPAVCYHVYKEYEKTSIDGRKLITAKNKCYRNESADKGLTRLREFYMREIVCIGTPGEILSFRSDSMSKIAGVARDLGISTKLEEASDPFFGDAQKMAKLQRLAKCKYELTAECDGGKVALASFNVHGNHFSSIYDIKSGNQLAWTACTAMGLERWTACLV
jgi:seryl-tRNA synthetase